VDEILNMDDEDEEPSTVFKEEEKSEQSKNVKIE